MKGHWEGDRDPLEHLAAGHPGLFEEFVRTEASTFLAYFRRLGAQPGEAEDLTQDLFMKLYRHATGYEARGRFHAFAFRVARNAWIDGRRRRVDPLEPESDGEGLLSAVPSPAPEPSLETERDEEAARLRAALARLPEHHREVFELGVLQELPYSEISALLEVPVGTVKSRMFYAVRRLRETLERPGDRPASRPA